MEAAETFWKLRKRGKYEDKKLAKDKLHKYIKPYEHSYMKSKHRARKNKDHIVRSSFFIIPDNTENCTYF